MNAVTSSCPLGGDTSTAPPKGGVLIFTASFASPSRSPDAVAFRLNVYVVPGLSTPARMTRFGCVRPVLEIDARLRSIDGSTLHPSARGAAVLALPSSSDALPSSRSGSDGLALALARAWIDTSGSLPARTSISTEAISLSDEPGLVTLTLSV